MINKELECLIREKIPYPLTSGQAGILQSMVNFLLDSSERSAFLLKGYAGTGKTTLVGGLIKGWLSVQGKVVLMAPTGRAAKVFSRAAQTTAYTIHRKIYRQKAFDGTEGAFELIPNLYRNTLFIVDEASMISNSGGDSASFGSGRLLDDLIRFVYAGKGCRLMLLGDAAQLPPVGTSLSVALAPEYLERYSLQWRVCELTEVVRQVQESGILWNATYLRKLIVSQEDMTRLPQLRISGFPDVERVTGEFLIERLEDAFYQCGMEETIVITRSNKRANIYNQGIRSRILGREEKLTSGDWVVIAKNNYYWIDEETRKAHGIDFIANGDMAQVRRVRRIRQVHGFEFADVLLEFPDYAHLEVEATVLLDTLESESPALTREQQEALFQAVWNDYAEVPTKKERISQLRQDIFFNALQIKYAYAVTCHKAQGGQWERVFVDQGYMPDDMNLNDYARWLYTAVTRASNHVYLVNWPSEQIQNS